MADPFRYFRIEAREILTQLQQDVLALEQRRAGADVVPRILRLAHTLKGAARVVKQVRIADLAHELEDKLVPFRDSDTALDQASIENLLSLVDAIAGHTATLGTPTEATQPQQSPAPTPLNEEVEPAAVQWRADPTALDPVLEGAAEVSVQLASLRRHADQLLRAQVLSSTLHLQLAAQKRDAQQRAVEPVRLAAELADLLSKLGPDVLAQLDQAGRELSTLRDSAERLRLVPAQACFGVLERTARDAARSLNKQVRVQFLGGDTRLEVEVLQSVQGALVQMVRNAVAHGIETPAERERRGKPAQGELTLSVARQGKYLAFTCSDDGGGIDLAAVQRGAAQRGLLTGSQPSANELFELLLRGGVSTSAQVSQVAGRGRGLDVVRTVAERWGGSVNFSTRAGEGTSLVLYVKAAISALDVLLVENARNVVSIPLNAVERTLRVTSEQVGLSAQGQSIVLDGERVTFVPLADILRSEGAEAGAQRTWSVAIINCPAGKVALGAERFLGVESVVLRAVPDYAVVDATIGGTSLDAEGNPRLVLDPEGVALAALSPRTLQRSAKPDKIPILVIDDSLTTRMLEQSILESAGYQVDLAVSGEDGLQKAALRKYALFLVDVEMPGIDGFTFVERTRQDPELARTPAILVTSLASIADVERGRRAGASGHIVKSEFDQTQFLKRVRDLIETSAGT